jgi:hypothetical protein
MAKRGPKRTPAERERDLVFVAEKYCEGWPFFKIAEALALSPSQITYDIKKVRKVWRENTTQPMEAHVDRALASIDHLESEAYVSWYISKGEDARVARTIVYDADESGPSVSRETISTSEDKPGDIRWLEFIDSLVIQRLQILFGADRVKCGGLARPAGDVIEGEVVAIGGGFTTDAQRIKETDRLIEVARSRLSEIAEREASKSMERGAVDGLAPSQQPPASSD